MKNEAWKLAILREDGSVVSRWDRATPWGKGIENVVPAPTEECAGLNCSHTVGDALVWVGYSNCDDGERLALLRVRYGGKVVESDAKLTCERMEALEAWVVPVGAWRAAREEYNKKCDAAWEEYNKKRGAAWEEYDKKRDAAWKEYEKKRVAAWEEYAKKHTAAWEEYAKKHAAAWKEYDKKHTAAWDKYGMAVFVAACREENRLW